MKIALLIPFLLLTSSLAFAKSELGSQCGLVDASSDDAIVDLTKTIVDLGEKLDIARLSTLQKQQIIVGAKALLAYDGEKPKFKNVEEALSALRESSSDGVYIGKITINGVRFDELMTYPGDNPVAAIFNEHTLSIRALIQDSDVVCY